MQFNDPINLNGIKQAVYFQSKINATTYSQNDLNRIINKYYRIIQEDLRSINENFFLISAATNLQLFSNNQGIYNFPTDYEKIKKIFISQYPVNKLAPVSSEFVPVTLIDESQITDPSYVFTTPTAVVFGSYFALSPTLNDATLYPVTNGVRMYYIPLQPDLVNDTDVPNFSASYQDVIVRGVALDIYARKGDNDGLAVAEKLFAQRRKEMKNDASGRILDVDPMYVEGQSTGAIWAFPFGKNSI